MEWKTTNDHEEIKAWVKKYSGEPTVISDNSNSGGSPEGEVIGFVFREEDPPEKRTRKRIGWEEFFDMFDTQGLAFRYRLNDKGEPDWNFINKDKNVVLPEDETTLPEDREEYEENVFPSAP